MGDKLELPWLKYRPRDFLDSEARLDYNLAERGLLGKPLLELGLLDDLLKLPHQKVRTLSGEIGDITTQFADFSHLPVVAPYIVLTLILAAAGAPTAAIVNAWLVENWIAPYLCGSCC